MVRVRFAPSPTGALHVGGVRTALFNFLFARRRRGSLILRIEDTDKERSSANHEAIIREAFEWLGLHFDESPWDGGRYGPYRQSERAAIHRAALESLLKRGLAFWCDHERAPEPENYAKPHWCEYRESFAGATGAIRFKTPKGTVVSFTDLVRGEISYNTEEIGDFVIAKNLESPLYNLANAVDDNAMEITHILRGEEHIANTPRQILLARALGLPKPQYAHFPLILAADRSKLSKRQGAVSVLEFRALGYLPQALLNFLALLGWHPSDNRELFSLAELIDAFSLERVQPSGAIFDFEKLDWMNGEYIRSMTVRELTEAAVPHIENAGIDISAVSREHLEKIIRLEQPRLKKLSEIGERIIFYFSAPEPDPIMLCWKETPAEETAAALEKAVEALQRQEPAISAGALAAELLAAAKEFGDRGKLLWPVRAALTGLAASPSPFDIINILGRDESIRRLNRARNSLKASH